MVVCFVFTALILGLDLQGIFRVTGAASKVRELRGLSEQGKDCKFPERAQPQDAATLLKAFIRELNEPLIPERLNKMFMKASEIKDTNQKLNLIRNLLTHIPRIHIGTLYYLINFLRQIADNSEKNSMTSSNLAVVLAPNIFKLEDADPMAAITSNSRKRISSLSSNASNDSSPDSDEISNTSKRGSIMFLRRQKVDPKETMKAHFAAVDVVKFMIDHEPELWKVRIKCTYAYFRSHSK
jgi:hypothetical protein